MRALSAPIVLRPWARWLTWHDVAGRATGHVRDHSTGYASLRNEIRSLARMRDDVTLMKLRQLSKDQHDTAQRRKKRQERMQQRAEAGEVQPPARHDTHTYTTRTRHAHCAGPYATAVLPGR